MDLISLDVSEIPAGQIAIGDSVDLIGGAIPLADVARAAGTIEYEILTSLGRRYHRSYQGFGPGAQDGAVLDHTKL